MVRKATYEAMGLRDVDISRTPEGIVVTGRTNHDLERCPHCGSDRLRKLATREETMFDVPENNKPVWIKLIKQRYHCAACSKTSLADVASGRLTGHRLTERLRDYIVQQGSVEAFSALCERIGTSSRNVRAVFDREFDALLKTPTDTIPRHLGLASVRFVRSDLLLVSNAATAEFHSILGSDLDLNQLVDDRKAEALAVETVVLSAADKGMKRGVELAFPNALVRLANSFPSFHANEAILSALKDYRRAASYSDKVRVAKSEGLLSRRYEELDEADQTVLKAWQDHSVPLVDAFNIKESFLSLWEADWEVSPDQFEAMAAQANALPGLYRNLRCWFPTLALGAFPRFDQYDQDINHLREAIRAEKRGHSADTIRSRLMRQTLRKDMTRKPVPIADLTAMLVEGQNA